MMLQAGRNVLCEKPMTLNHRDTKELIDLAKEKNIFFMEVSTKKQFFKGTCASRKL